MNPQTAADFPPQFLTFFLRCTVASYEVPAEVFFSSKAKATSVCAALNNMRSKMKKEGSAHYPTIANVVLHVGTEPDGRGRIWGHPKIDRETYEAFAAIGITEAPVPTAGTAAAEPPRDFFKELGELDDLG